MSLYRFSKREYLEDFVQGKLSFAPALFYDDVRLSLAQRDNEVTRTLKPDLKKSRFFINNSPINGLREVELKHTARDSEGDIFNYYLMSLSTECDEKFFNEFKADSCVEVVNEVEFENRLSEALNVMNWKGLLGAVNYFDSKALRGFTENNDILFSKPNGYGWQKEYRVVIFPLEKEIMNGRKVVDVGDLSDIVRFVR